MCLTFPVTDWVLFECITQFQCDAMNRSQNRKKYSKGRRRKRNNRRNKSFKFSKIQIRQAEQPDSVRVVLKYSELLQRAPGTTFDEYIFAGNSCYDPNVTGTGSQPVGFDQWSALYGKYRVVGSKIKASFINNVSSNNIYFSVIPVTASSGVTGFNDAVGQPYSRWCACTPPTGMSRARIVNRMTTSKIYGQNISTDDVFAATTGANPSSPWYWVINAVTAHAVNLGYDMEIEIFYDVIFFKRIPNDLSLNGDVWKQHLQAIIDKQKKVTYIDEKKDDF